MPLSGRTSTLKQMVARPADFDDAFDQKVEMRYWRRATSHLLAELGIDEPAWEKRFRAKILGSLALLRAASAPASTLWGCFHTEVLRSSGPLPVARAPMSTLGSASTQA